MGYHSVCTSCYGRKPFEGDPPCHKCAGHGKVKPYRRNITIAEGAALGWNEMISSPRKGKPGWCIVCGGKLPGKKRTFCGAGCRNGYFFRVWKGAHWQKRAVAERDGAACRGCGEVFESPIRPGGPAYPEYGMLELDHKRPLHMGGTEHPDNLQLLCPKCHGLKTIRDRRRITIPTTKSPARTPPAPVKGPR
jgi:hypothetical protein